MSINVDTCTVLLLMLTDYISKYYEGRLVKTENKIVIHVDNTIRYTQINFNVAVDFRRKIRFLKIYETMQAWRKRKKDKKEKESKQMR